MTYERFVLKTSARWITVEPADPAVPHDKVLFLDRRVSVSRGDGPLPSQSGSASEASSDASQPPPNGKLCTVRDRIECAALAEPDSERIVYGVVGLVTLLVDAYLIVIDSREKVGSIFERDVYRVKKLTAIPVRGSKILKKDKSVSKADRTQEAELFGMLKQAISLPGFYFSHGIDITRATQKRLEIAATSRAVSASPDFSRAEMRFVWNRYVGKPLAEAGVTTWVAPLILGYVDVREGLVNGKSVQLALISRRAADRPGLRFTARGADIHGNVSNFVETEQIVTRGDSFASYVQVRGSIPLLWQQEACIKYKPAIRLKQMDAGGKEGLSQQAFEKHYESLFQAYGPVTSISLIDNKGGEAVLASALSSAVDLMKDSRLHFVPWDFHTKCKGMKYENVDNELVQSIDKDLGHYSYFLVADGNSSSPSMRQKGIVRTNCIDSLDRTNVVQSAIAHRIMDDALKQMGVLDTAPETSAAKSFKDFESKFKTTWANHADALSLVYSGSGALKTDYTRTGKRTKAGLAKDGFRSGLRYVYQNFLDGRRQDGIDLFLGVVSLEQVGQSNRDLSAIRSPRDPLSVKEKFLPHIMLVLMTLAMVCFVAAPKWWQKIIAHGMCISGAVFVFGMIAKNGEKYAARPKLKGTI